MSLTRGPHYCFQDYSRNILFIRSYIDNSMYISIKARPIMSVFEYLSPLIVMMIYSSSKWKEEKKWNAVNDHHSSK